jgi:hypothetical protein
VRRDESRVTRDEWRDKGQSKFTFSFPREEISCEVNDETVYGICDGMYCHGGTVPPWIIINEHWIIMNEHCSNPYFYFIVIKMTLEQICFSNFGKILKIEQIMVNNKFLL